MAISRALLVANSCLEAPERTWTVGTVICGPAPIWLASGSYDCPLVFIHLLNKDAWSTYTRLWEHNSCSVFTIPGDLLACCTDFSRSPRWKDVSSRVPIGLPLGIKVAGLLLFCLPHLSVFMSEYNLLFNTSSEKYFS